MDSEEGWRKMAAAGVHPRPFTAVSIFWLYETLLAFNIQLKRTFTTPEGEAHLHQDFTTIVSSARVLY
jgi:hypothetical protein